MLLNSIATWNVNSIAARLPLVAGWLEQRSPDVLCLQEIKCVEEKFPAAVFEAMGYHSLVFGQPTYNGVATLVRSDLAPTIEQVHRGFPDENGEAQRRLLAATIGGVRVVNVYIPNGQAVGTEKYGFKLEWLGRLRDYFDAYCDPSRPLALCGDYNVAPEDIDVHDPQLWRGKILFSEPEKAALSRVQQWGLHDAYRALNPTGAEFSWWDYRQAAYRRNMGLRIDHIWLTRPLLDSCRMVEIDPAPRKLERPSDHTPVVAHFKTQEPG